MSKDSMGTCPKCGSDNIDYLGFDIPSDIISHECECKNCGLHFYEYEALVYDGYSYTDEFGIDHNFGSDGSEK